MAAALRVELDRAALARVRRTLSTLKQPKLATVTRNFLLMAGYAVLKDAAENQIIRGGRFRGPAGQRGGKGALRDTPPHPSRLTSRSGELRRSLGLSRGTGRAGLPRFIDVGSDLVYAPIHELGLGRYPVRAFLAPALLKVSSRFEAMLFGELAKAIDGVKG